MNNKTSLVIIIVMILVTIVTIFFLIKSESSIKQTISSVVSKNNEKQEIKISAGIEGYTPTKIIAYSDTDTTLIVNSIEAFGCETLMTIPKLGIRQSIPTNGQTEVTIPKQPKGTKLLVACSMGMYTTTISFI